MRISTRWFGLLFVAAGCASSSGGSPSSTTATPQAAPNRNRDLISKEELSDPQVRSQTVLEAVRSLRPNFLNVRGAQGIVCKSPSDCAQDPDAGSVHVSVDGGRILPLDELEHMHVNSVIDIQYLNVAQAMQKFGGAAREGPVILVRTIAK